MEFFDEMLSEKPSGSGHQYACHAVQWKDGASYDLTILGRVPACDWQPLALYIT
jgi:hypothetical protein